LNLSSDYIEKLILKTALTDKHYLLLIANSFEGRYFESLTAKQIFNRLREHVEKYHEIPDHELLINLDGVNYNDVKSYLDDVDNVNIDIAKQLNYIYDVTNEYLKDAALKNAVMDTVDIISKNGDKSRIRSKFEDALAKNLNIDLGLDYFNTIGERIKRMIDISKHKVPTYFYTLDEIMNGGMPPYTLNIILGKIHGAKSQSMANFAARQVINGHTVVIITLEMSQDMFAQRFDGIYSNLDINKMYTFKTERNKLINTLTTIKNNDGLGKLYIKEFPTGVATVNDYRVYLRELKLRGIIPDIIYVDYINIMKPTYKSKDDMYSDIKMISEELRALSWEFKAPVFSVSQLNREGIRCDFDAVDFSYIAEGIAAVGTADFLAIIGVDEEKLIYENELHFRIEKNRLGGQVGRKGLLYMDPRSLKMYDETEEEVWISDAKELGIERVIHK